MTPKEQYQKALQLARAGDYPAAKAILSKMNHPKATELLAKVNAVLAKQKPAKKPMSGIAKFGLFLLLIFIGVAFTVLYFVNAMNATFEDINENLRVGLLELTCNRLHEDSPQCRAESERIASEFPTEAQACLDRSNDGRLEFILRDCLKESGIEFAIDDGRPNAPGG